MAGPRAVLVDRFSATYPRQWDSESFHEGFNRTHSDLVKFSVGDVDYLRVLSVLQDFTSKATASIVSHLVNQGTKKSALSILQYALHGIIQPVTDL